MVLFHPLLQQQIKLYGEITMSTPALAPVASNVTTMSPATAPSHWDKHSGKYMVGGAFVAGVAVGYGAAYYFGGKDDDEAVVVPPSASKAKKAEAAAA